MIFKSSHLLHFEIYIRTHVYMFIILYIYIYIYKLGSFFLDFSKIWLFKIYIFIVFGCCF